MEPLKLAAKTTLKDVVVRQVRPPVMLQGKVHRKVVIRRCKIICWRGLMGGCTTPGCAAFRMVGGL